CVPAGDSKEEVTENFRRKSNRLRRARLDAVELRSIKVADQFEGHFTDLEVDLAGSVFIQGGALEDEGWSFTHAVDGLDCHLQGLEEMRAFHERTLPAAFEVEVVEGGVAEIDGECCRFEACENRIARFLRGLQANAPAVCRALLDQAGGLGKTMIRHNSLS